VHCAVPDKSSPGCKFALKAVEAVLGDVIVMPVPPLCQVHAKVYPGVPPVAVTVVMPVVLKTGANPLALTTDGDEDADREDVVFCSVTEIVFVLTEVTPSEIVQKADALSVLCAFTVAKNVVL
jgi:hypothetical protein